MLPFPFQSGGFGKSILSGDPYFDKVVLLLHCDGANGSTTFTDRSRSPKTVTANGNAQISTAQSKFGGSSALFDGTGDNLSSAYTTANFDWWTTDYTIEGYVYATAFTTWYYLDGTNKPALIGNAATASVTNYWSFGPIDSGKISFYYFNGSSQAVNSTATLNTSQQNHIAMVVSSGVITLYVNGTASGTASIAGTPQSSTGQNLVIGQINNRSITGYLDELRITKGVARYTANFTPPTEPFPNF